MQATTTRDADGLAIAHAVRRTLRGYRARLGLLRGLSLACAAGMQMSVAHAELPVICVSGALCGNSSSIIDKAISDGTSYVTSGNTMTVTQTTANATLNWQSFTISSGSSVNFVQADSSSVALNRIYQSSASQILGNLTANGRVYLLNQNGIVFGNGAQVNVAGLIASSLNLSAAALDADGNTSLLNAGKNSSPAFQLYASGESGDVMVMQGATITTPDGGQVLMFAPNATNLGSISTPGGQTVLAAGNSVYLSQSNDENLVGFLVEVGVGGTVTNGDEDLNKTVTDPTQLVGQIVAERGNITLAGLAVNQYGRVSATTSVNENGSIRLQARDGGKVENSYSGLLAEGNNGGDLELGQNSVTEVQLATDGETAVDDTEQRRSQIELSGERISILEDAQVIAKGGNITISARDKSPDALLSGTATDSSRIYIASGAVLDVSGADVTKSMESNVISVELYSSELADSPVQRDGVLYRETVYVDIREGTSVADVSEHIAGIERDVAERNLLGGTITLESQGDVIVAAGSTIDISGGSITYQDGYINTTKLLGADGKIYDIADADPDRTYVGIAGGSTYTVTDSRWGTTKTYTGATGSGSYEQGYIEGKDAGTLSVVAPTAILDGDIVAQVQVGRYQRELATALADGQIYRPYDQLPLGGQLIIGLNPDSSIDRITGDVAFGGELVLPTLLNDDPEFDPETDELPASVNTTSLRSELFGEDRITRVEVNSNGSVTLPEEVTLSLSEQGALKIRAADVEIAGQVTAHSGSIDIASLSTALNANSETSVHLASTALLDVSGQWVNDSSLLNNGGQLAPLLIEGGDINVSAESGSLRLDSGSVLDASGGAWADSDGNVVAGDAGSISLSASGDPSQLQHSVVLELGAELKAFGFENGGTLSISAPEICVASDGQCGSGAEGTLQLTPEALLAGGFSDISLRSNERGLLVESGTQIDLQQRNRVLNVGALNAATGSDLDSLSSIALLPDYLRAATDLSLRTSVYSSDDVAYTNANFSSASGLVIESGVSINADPGASLALQSNTTIFVDGELTAKGGTIDLLLDNTLEIGESLDAQGIWLDSNAVLDVSGTTLLEPNASGLRTGTVLDGGTVAIVAQRGAVIANPGSMIDVSGASATLDIRSTGSAANTTPTVVASDGGTVSVIAADAILLSGSIDAHAGAGSATASGGKLHVELDPDRTIRYGSQDGSVALPVEEHRIVVSQSSSPVSIAAGSALSETYLYQALVAADDIEAAGFDQVTLRANSSEGVAVSNGPIVDASGTIEFAGNVTLSVGRELVLDAARITGDGDVTVSAAYVALGHSDTGRQQVVALGGNDGGTFIASAAFIEVIGNSAIDGFAKVTLDSAGDLRLRGIQADGASTVEGSLTTNADLTLRADQVYATTLSDFEVAVANNPEGVLRVEATGEARDAVWSAASYLTLSAPTIEQAGVLRAPFGTIELNADTLTLEAGSLTSTSAEDEVILFGEIQADTDWVYSLDGQTLVVGDTLDVPEQKVVLNGDAVSVDAGAVIDISGGGDLLGYEFISGTGGSVDVLSSEVSPNSFAIVPTSSLTYAAYDTQESDTTLSVGDTIHISAGVDGLPEGDYVLLPARYALLEGAYLVEAVSGYTDLQAGEVVQQLNGSTIVSGYMMVANTDYADARTSGYLVTPASVLAEQAEYDTHLASEFFTEQAEASGTAVARLAQDAGVVSITAISQLNIDGELRARALEGGRGGAVDISAENLVVSDTATAASGEVVVSASDLNSLGAESILLGGSRSSSAAGVSIDVNADTVTIAGDAALTVSELLLTATDTVRVASGASLTASGEATADTYVLDGDGAALRLAGGEQANLQRNNETGTAGTLILEQGAQLTATNGALALDASLDLQSEAALSLDSGSLSLGASRINLADTGVTAAGFTLDAAQLSMLNLDQLQLVSRSSIDLYGDIALDVNELKLDAAGLRSQQSGASASIAADSIVLANTAQRTDADATTSGGTLQLGAESIVIADGTQRLSGYNEVALIANEQVRGEGTGGVDVVGGLTLSTPVLLASTGSDTTLAAIGDLRVTTANSVADAQTALLGGELTLSGAAVSIGSRIEAAAGAINVTASTGDVTLLNGAVLDAAGRTRDFDDTVVAAGAGEINLLATQGNVVAQSGSAMNLAAAEDGKAGALDIAAANGSVTLAGTITASALEASDSGTVSIDANTLGDVSAMNAALNAAGFNAARELRQRSGDVTLANADRLTAQQVTLTADTGSVVIDGVIDAGGTDGGEVVLSAGDDVIVNGSVLAAATSDAGEGGEVDLRADAGAVRINSGAVIDLSAGADNTTDGGELNLRVERQLLADTLTDADSSNDAVVLAGNFIGVEQTSLEAYARYTDTQLGLVDGVITSTQTAADISNVLFREASEFIGNQADIIKTALGLSDDDSFHLLAGIEIQSAGDLTLDADWNLYDWQFGDEAGVLTLRAAGDLTFNRSLSDGFESVTAFELPNVARDSWSYRLIAGADNTSADLLAVGDDAEADVAIAAGTLPSDDESPGTYRMVRTGNGEINVAASGDFRLGNQASTLYTAGVASADGVKIEGLNYLDYPVDGGDISIDVGQDVEGAQTNQLVTDWLWRVGAQSSGDAFTDQDGQIYATAWTVNFARFMQNVGALGGGNVDVSAGGDIRNFSVSIPSIGQQVGSQFAYGSEVNVIGGGDLSVRAGGNIAGGSYYVGLGNGDLIAGGDIASSYYASAKTNFYPILALGDGEWNVVARGSAGIEAVVNPTSLPQGKSQGSSDPNNNLSLTVFFTYADTSAVNILSTSGDAILSNNVSSLTALTSMDWGADVWQGIDALLLYAPNLSVASLSADLVLNGQIALFPAEGSSLQLFAEDSIVRGSSAGTKVVVPDVDPAYLPSIDSPWLPRSALYSDVALAFNEGSSDAHAAIPVHAEDDSVAHLVARTGNIDFTMQTPTDQSKLLFATPARIVAGGDIIDLPLVVQHDDASDVTSIEAGGDLYYTVMRSEAGIIQENSKEIAVDGPGTLLVSVGGDIDLQTSGGISSRGNLMNTNLADDGASINLVAGLNGKQPDYATFEQQYLVDIDTYAAALDEYVEQMTGTEPDSHASALTLFAALSEQQKAPFLQKVLLAELRASAIDAASADPEKNGDYSRGFAAMNTLFPDGDAYDGDIALYFSRIYTLDGGDITLLTPGGGVNAGLASPPSAFGITKTADRLGIVTQLGGDIGIAMDEDLLVNESRVVAVNDSDILVWSSNGDIDAGRGAKTAISAPQATINYDDPDGFVTVIYSASLDGSGIQTRTASAEFSAGDVVLAAPRGVVNAGDAGIVAGNLTIAATAVLGADNIKVSGVAVGVPVDTGGLGASLAGVSAAASGASNSATMAVTGDDASSKEQAAPMAQEALSWLEVFVVGLGEDNCRQDDVECLKRQSGP